LTDQPLAAANALDRLGVLALEPAQRLLGLASRRFGAPQVGYRAVGALARRMLFLSRTLALADQPVSLVTTREHPLGAALGELAHLAPRAEPDASGARHGDSG